MIGAGSGELDDTTPPLHALKYAAALQRAQGCDNPVWLRMAWGAGHAVIGGGEGQIRAAILAAD